MRDEIVQYIKDEKIGRGITLMEDGFCVIIPTASTVLGTGTDNQGLAGIETEYDSELFGTAGSPCQREERTYDQYVQAQDGYDLVLTIDETAQSIVEKHLQAGLDSRRAGGRHGRFDERQDRRDFGAFHKGRLRPERPVHHFAGGRRRYPEKVEDAEKAQERSSRN